MKTFNYSAIRQQKWDSDVLGLIAAIYKEAGKQELYLKQRPEELEKLVEIAKIRRTCTGTNRLARRHGGCSAIHQVPSGNDSCRLQRLRGSRGACRNQAAHTGNGTQSQQKKNRAVQ